MTNPDPLWEQWPSSVTFHHVSPRLAHARLVRLGVTTVVVVPVTAVAAYALFNPVVAAIIVGAGLIIAVIRALITLRAVAAWGYAERDDDLVIRHGIWTKRQSIVPYGRMQLIDVAASPFERLYGLATVTLHTAAATTDATVPGLDPTVAADLRDRLADRAKAEKEGL